MKKVWMAILVTLVVAIIFSPLIIRRRLVVIQTSEWYTSYTLDDISGLGVDVVRAIILSSIDEPHSHTIYTIRILETFQGELLTGGKIEIAQWRDEPIRNRNSSRRKDWISMEPDDDLVLLLRTSNSPASIFAVYRLPESVSVDVELDASVRLRGVRSRRLLGDGIELTVEDLWNLRDD